MRVFPDMIRQPECGRRSMWSRVYSMLKRRVSGKGRVRAFMLIPILLLLSSCIEGFDSLNGADEAYYRLYDYRIDRPRVLGISYQPIFPSGGDLVTFNALAASPEHLTDAKVEWWGCGLTLDEPFAYYGADCLQTSLAEYLGTGSTLEVELPKYQTDNCSSDGCYGYIPIIAVMRGRGETGDDQEGYGLTYISPDYQDELGPLPMELDLYSASIELTMDGMNPGQAAPGEEIALDVRVETYASELQFSWYVSSGTLRDLGVTLTGEIEWGTLGKRNVLHAFNTLVVPEDEREGRIFIYVVIDPVEPEIIGLERFVTGEIEVMQ